MERQHVFGTLLAASVMLASGCGVHTPAARLVAAPVEATAPHVNHQSAALTITAPASATSVGTGAIAINFKLPAHKAFALMTTPDDVQKITVTLKTKSLLFLTKTLATAEVTRAQMLANRAAVQFTGLKASKYTMDISALDGTGTTLGSTTVSADVADGQTAMVEAKLKVSTTTAVNPSGSGASLGVNLDISNGQP